MKMSAQMTVVAVLATLAWLGLAVWGIGGVAMFFSHGSLVIVALATVAMVAASLPCPAKGTRANNTSNTRNR